ncbi:DUF4153 domain-containing protein [Aliisedimentitalea scapharcae]|uniref:DUF4153 domain-containing protein n=1 Tax=Aliisedimentitalea scapharcae TaxID=1524259 RepID=A0ABZ2XY50_9RHOB
MPASVPAPSSASLMKDRLLFSVLGSGLALALWGLGENWNHSAWPRGAFLAAFTFVSVYAAVVLALIGPVSMGRALIGAGLIAVPATVLVSLGGQRYVDPMQLLDRAPALTVTVLLVYLATPFLSVILRNRSAWRDYALLFDTAWSFSTRYLLAWILVSVFWLLVFLSDALMNLIGIDLIERLLDSEWVVFGLSGGVLGLGLAVVYELRQTLSPFVVLRMFRMLVPFVLVIVALFLAALPFRGLSQLFGAVSSAGTLMSVCISAICLISIAVDRDDDARVSSAGLNLATRGLAILLPGLAGLAIWAIAIRVAQYGWTPDRVLAAVFSIVLGLYGAGYAGASLINRRWTGLIRGWNVIMAFGVMTVSAAWLTPVLDANRISTNSQITRFSAGELTTQQLALWAMQHDWGTAGQAGLARLEALVDHPEHAQLVQSIEVVQTQPDKYRFEQTLIDQRAPEELAQLVAAMPVRPENNPLSVADLSGLPEFRRTQWLTACTQIRPEGTPGCVMIRGQFLPGSEEQAMVLFVDEFNRTRVNHLIVRADGVQVQDAYDMATRGWPELPANAVADALNGDFDLRPRGGVALHIGGQTLEAIP